MEEFAEWFGSAETQAAWGEEFDSYPCNTAAADMLYGPRKVKNSPSFTWTLMSCRAVKSPNLTTMSLSKVDGDTTYAEYVAAHSSDWTNIMTNLGFYWADASEAKAVCSGVRPALSRMPMYSAM